MSGDELEEAATAAADDIVTDATAREIDAIDHVERGSSADVILDSIKPNEIHAIVMGTTGRSGIDRILLGSVAEQTVRTAPVPVITVARES